MKSLLLSADDIQSFTKLIYDPKALHLSKSNIVDSGGGIAASNYNLMALQYYLKHPKNQQESSSQPQQQRSPQSQVQHHHYIAAAILNPPPAASSSAATQTQQQHQLLVQSQNQLRQLQLKQPSTTHQQHNNYQIHHHPYYQQNVVAIPAVSGTNALHTSLTLAANSSRNSGNVNASHSHLQHQPNMPIHALNQNSNFSAASSSTGASGTISSHNTTGSSLSPPAAATASGRGASTAVNSAIVSSSTTSASTQQQVRTSIVSGTKKVKTEPILSQYYQSERLSFANTHIVWNEEQWKRVVFHDERKFNLDGPDGFSYYFHDLRNYERTLSQRPRGNSVYVYLLITVGGPIHLEVSTSKLKSEICIETILRERVNIIAKLGGSGTDFVLQDHNWSANNIPTAQEWLSSEGIKLQKWPTIAHDLNIMENIWGWLIREVFDGGRKFSRKDDLIFRIREAWSRLPLDLITNLYSTLPERIMELYYTRGIYTNC